MRSAAELEESMDKSPVTPGAVVPARELLAELLQEQKQPQQAVTEYDAVLKVAPNRFNALWGAASTCGRGWRFGVGVEVFPQNLRGWRWQRRPEWRRRVRRRVVAAQKSGVLGHRSQEKEASDLSDS